MVITDTTVFTATPTAAAALNKCVDHPPPLYIFRPPTCSHDPREKTLLFSTYSIELFGRCAFKNSTEVHTCVLTQSRWHSQYMHVSVEGDIFFNVLFMTSQNASYLGLRNARCSRATCMIIKSRIIFQEYLEYQVHALIFEHKQYSKKQDDALYMGQYCSSFHFKSTTVVEVILL